MWARRTRLLVTGGILTILLLSTLLLEAPEPTRTVDEIMNNPDSFVGSDVAIRGEVIDGSIDNETLTFMLEGENAQILISFKGAAVSNGLDDNRTVYAEGKIVNVHQSTKQSREPRTIELKYNPHERRMG
jgi:starvation-inducible outer membrane lipoprotein